MEREDSWARGYPTGNDGNFENLGPFELAMLVLVAGIFFYYCRG